MSTKYPYFVEKQSEFFKEHHQFVGFYMPDADYDKLISLYPDGINDDHVSEYTVPLRGKKVTDWLYTLDQDKRVMAYDLMRELQKINQILLWDWSDLLHSGYHPMFDENLNLLVGKGKIKPNKHTCVVLLEKVPARIEKLWKEITKNYIIPMQKIVENFLPD